MYHTHLDPLSLARALEGAEAAGTRLFCEAAAAVYPDLPIRTIPIAGGAAFFYSPNDPLNAVKGVGLNGPVDESEWAALEAFHRDRGSRIVIDLCPLADEAWVALLAKRGYTIAGFETVTCRTIAPGEVLPAAPAAPGLSLTLPESLEQWGRVMTVGFADGGEPFKLSVDFARVREHLSGNGGSRCSVLASINGQPAGGAALSIHEGVAHLGGAAVLPEFRGRGIQTALSAFRLKLAQDRGCTLVKLDVRAGTSSYRNALRAGFQLAYTRPQIAGPA